MNDLETPCPASRGRTSTRRVPALAAAAAALAFLVGCKRPDQNTAIRMDGSSTVFPISEAVAEAFLGQRAGARVTVGISGTGGGFKKFCNGETEGSNASRPIKPTEVAACEKAGIQYVELPVAYDGITIIVNPKNDWATSITAAELKTIWQPESQGKVAKWSDVRPGWPEKPLRLYGAGVDSGTYDYFTEAINHKEHASRGDYTSSEDDNVIVTGVANDEAALGFLGFAYFDHSRDKLKAVPVDDGKKENGDGPIAPSLETIRDATYQPLSRPIFVYFAVKALEREQVTAFVEFYLTNAPKLTKEVGYIPLPDRAYELGRERVRRRVAGSIFGGKGSQVGVSIEELLAKGMP